MILTEQKPKTNRQKHQSNIWGYVSGILVAIIGFVIYVVYHIHTNNNTKSK